MPDTDTWTQTGLIRWYNGTLQQQWYGSSSGINKWEDVPEEGDSGKKPKVVVVKPARKRKR